MQLSIVSYLDEAATKTVRQLQQELSAITGSVASLNSWAPHITIGNGIKVKDATLKSVETTVGDVAASTAPFTIKLSGFGSKQDRRGGIGETTTPYVLLVEVEVSQSLLNLVEKIRLRVTSSTPEWYQMPQPYRPHITLAFRDLSKEGFHSGLDFLQSQDMELKTTIDHIALVEKRPSSDIEFKRFGFHV